MNDLAEALSKMASELIHGLNKLNDALIVSVPEFMRLCIELDQAREEYMADLDQFSGDDDANET